MADEKIITEFLDELDRVLVKLSESDRHDTGRLWFRRAPEEIIYGLVRAQWLRRNPSDFGGRGYHLGLLADLTRKMKGWETLPACPECGKLNVELSPEYGAGCGICKSVVNRWLRSEIPTISPRYWPAG